MNVIEISTSDSHNWISPIRWNEPNDQNDENQTSDHVLSFHFIYVV